MNALALYVLLLKATFLSFSGFASVPLVRDALVVHQHMLSDTQLNDAIAISQASPGPLGIYVVIVGYMVAGPGGGLAGMLALATPAVLAVPVLLVVQRGRVADVRGATSGILIASCALMCVTLVNLAPTALGSPALITLGVLSAGALMTTRLPPVLIILVTAALGLVL